MRYDPDFPYNPPRNGDATWRRLDVDIDVPSVDTLWKRHVPARREHRDDSIRGGAR